MITPAFLWFLSVIFLMNFAVGVLPPLLPQIMDGLRLTYAEVGLIGASFGLARFLVDVPAGLVVDRLGERRVLLLGVILIATGSLVCGFSRSLLQVVLGRAIVGLGSGVGIVASLLHLMRTFPADFRVRAANVYELAILFAMAASAAVGGWVAARSGWRAGFLLAGAMGVLGLGVAWGKVTASPWRAEPVVVGPTGGPAKIPGTPRRMLAVIYASTFSLSAGWAGVVNTYVPLYGGRRLGLSSETIGGILTLGFILEALLLLPVGWLSDTRGRVRVINYGLLVLIAGLVLLPLTGGKIPYAAGVFFFTAGFSVWMIPPSLLADLAAGGLRGRAVGAYRFISDSAYFLAPFGVSWAIGGVGFRGAALAVILVFAGNLMLNLWALGRRAQAVGIG